MIRGENSAFNYLLVVALKTGIPTSIREHLLVEFLYTNQKFSLRHHLTVLVSSLNVQLLLLISGISVSECAVPVSDYVYHFRLSP